jgi:coenzyme F420-0:L-glutamate ligase/coenzyme F420-1:gamma-L-glutamate ligase
MLTHNHLTITPVVGIGDISPGDDLASLIAQAAPWLTDGDILVVTSKIVSKAEGQLIVVPTDGPDREEALEAALTAETACTVATRGHTKIVKTHHGFVMASAGIDYSNVDSSHLLLLPKDPDSSARSLRSAFAERGLDVAVIITDTMGRPWRNGLVDVAIGAAGIAPLLDHRGHVDIYGNELSITQMAVVDELAAAAELVKGKIDQIPVAVVRGYVPASRSVRPRTKDCHPNGSPHQPLDHRNVAVPETPGVIETLVRDAEHDLFSLGTAEARALGRREAMTWRRSVRSFSSEPVPDGLIRQAVTDALTAPAPHHSAPWRFVHIRAARTALLTAMRDAWITDLRSDGLAESAITRRLRRGNVLWAAPELVVPCLVADSAHFYPDIRRSKAEETMFHVAMGAGVQNFLISLSVTGLGSCWVSSTLFCPDIVRTILELPEDWQPMGAVAIGYPASPPAVRTGRDPDDYLVSR